jgi:hypothetical protein
MTPARLTCTLTRADEPACQSYARVTIIDSKDRGSGKPLSANAAGQEQP